MSDPIILIGFMGTGKDTVGMVLARKTGMGFISTDRFIELSHGKSIMDIFNDEGEEQFRELERSALNLIVTLHHTVIATGGGIVMQPENRTLLKKSGIVVHLTASLDVIQERLRACCIRPLALDPGEIARVYHDRQGMYDIADITVATGDLTPGDIADHILQDLEIRSRSTPIQPVEMDVATPSAPSKVICGTDLLNDQAILRSVIGDSLRVCVVTNPLVGALYLDPLKNIFQSMKPGIEQVILPDGEEYKTWSSAQIITDHLMKKRFSRSDILIGLGGGVISDITGFVAATFKRGMRCVFFPTTLLAQVDAAIGGKNGVNHDQGKNMIGTFYQPEKVISDVDALKTLPEKEFQNGMAEVIKYAIIHDKELFTMLEKEHDRITARDRDIVVRVIERCVQLKSAMVVRDERETLGIRHILNYGHTVGHAIETLTRYQSLTHGQAVAMGMVIEAKAAVNHGYLDVQDYDRIVVLIKDYGLPATIPDDLNMKAVRELVTMDKKVQRERIIMPVVQHIGAVVVKEVSCKTFL